MQSLWQMDQELFRWVHLSLHQDWLDPVFWLITSTGLGYVQLALIAASSAFSKLRPFVPALLASWAISGIGSTVAKKLMDRDRPSNLAIARPQESFFFDSFPSGHTTTAFGLACMFWLLVRGTELRRLGYLAWLWACLVAFSRVYRGVHWPTDVLGGALIGCGTSCLLFALLKQVDWLTPRPNRSYQTDQASPPDGTGRA